MLKNIFYAQSGGATAVINASACGVIHAANQHHQRIGKVYAGHSGILGALREELIDISQEDPADIDALRYTPSCAFGSCRYKLQPFDKDPSEYERIVKVFKAHHIGYFFYNGGGDSQDTAYKISQMSQRLNYPLTCIGIPKTIDNDLPFTDNSPGFGSVAKYVAISTQEAAMDIASMAATSTKVFLLEVMGRHAGWIAAASALARRTSDEAPHIILLPEVPFQLEAFLCRVKETVNRVGYCVIVVSEGLRHPDGRFMTETDLVDAFGHEQLGGVAPILARLIKRHLGYKYHYAVADYLQRAARHIASKVDVDQAYALGKAAVEFALEGKNNVMLTLERQISATYQWTIGTTPLNSVANVEYKMPRHFISEDGFHVTPDCLNYLAPLIEGECYPPYNAGLPKYAKLKKVLVEKKLSEAFALP